ncbi:hypothetical protein [Kitasatospora sp. NPDC085464]|uniref:hypothetical protein n=1 Tax=Kitasatospora sp. NPDC085464 TaxID=3364063 RepID=UPI0037CC3D42
MISAVAHSAARQPTSVNGSSSAGARSNSAAAHSSRAAACAQFQSPRSCAARISRSDCPRSRKVCTIRGETPP